MQSIIKAANLTKTYGALDAVKSLDLDIRKGEIYGFIGLNGAGKTTTIRMLLGMIKPTAGHVELFGERIGPDSTSVWPKVGFLVETATAYPDLTVEENLEVSRRLYKTSDENAVFEVMEKLNLTQYKGKKAKHLSLGNSQRLSIAKALLHGPKLLILDEPTNGLDPAGIVEIRKLLQGLAESEGVTVFISSHILGEVYRFTTKIGIIDQGVLIEEMDIGTLNRKMGERLVLDADDRHALLSVVQGLGFRASTNNKGEIELDDPMLLASPEAIVARLVEEGIPPKKVNVEKEDLEQYFLSKVGADD